MPNVNPKEVSDQLGTSTAPWAEVRATAVYIAGVAAAKSTQPLDTFGATTDITTNDATSSKHGFMSKADKVKLDTINLDAITDGDMLKATYDPGNVAGDAFALSNMQGTLATSQIEARAVTYAKLPEIPTARLLGRVSTGAGDIEPITQGQALTFLGVEAGATADQTGAEIKSLYEAETDTNAFTDASVTKLAAAVTGPSSTAGTSPLAYFDGITGKVMAASGVTNSSLIAIDAFIADRPNTIHIRGDWDASGGTFPTSAPTPYPAGSGFRVIAGGTVDSQVFATEDLLVSIVSDASDSTFSANWIRLIGTPAVQSDWDASSGAAVILNKPTLGTAAAASTGDFEAAGAIATHAAVASGVHGISAFGATLVDDADASTARSTIELGSGDAVEFASCRVGPGNFTTPTMLLGSGNTGFSAAAPHRLDIFTQNGASTAQIATFTHPDYGPVSLSVYNRIACDAVCLNPWTISDVTLMKSATDTAEINSGTAGDFRDLKVRSLTATGTIIGGNINGDGSALTSLNPSAFGVGSGAINLQAGGTNQDVSLTPSGSGRVKIPTGIIEAQNGFNGIAIYNGATLLFYANTTNLVEIGGLGLFPRLDGGSALGGPPTGGFDGGWSNLHLHSSAGVRWNNDTALTRASAGVVSAPAMIFSGAIRPPSYTVSAALALVGMAAGDTIFVTNEVGGAVLATYNGSAWKRQTDLATIS
jgi:hypothetical protein